MKRLLARYMAKRTEELLIAQFVVRLTYILMVVVAIIIALDVGGLDGTATNLLAGAGLSAIILGFGFKDIGENFLAGILLAFKRPFRIGDVVEIEGISGRITGLDLRETMVEALARWALTAASGRTKPAFSSKRATVPSAGSKAG